MIHALAWVGACALSLTLVTGCALVLVYAKWGELP